MKLPLATWAVLVAQLTAAMPSAGPIDWPDSRAGQMAAAFLQAFNAEDEAAMRRFLQEKRDAASLQRLPLEQRMVQHRQMRQQLGTLEVGSVSTDGDLKAQVIAKSSTMGIWLSLSFELQSAEPYKLAHFGMRPAAAPADPESPARFAAWENLQALASEACREGQLPAIVIAVMHAGQIQESAVAGVRQAGGSSAAQLGDRFQMGSITKAMTATLIGRLVDAGALRWDLRLPEVLADVAMRPEYASVTLEQLLQHRGGLRAYADDRTDAFPDLAQPGRSATQERALFAQQVLNEAPVGRAGSVHYSNAGYAVAALVAERVTEKPFEELMQSLLFQPLHMQTAHFGWPASRQRGAQPRGHMGNAPDLRVQGLDDEPWETYMLPAGGVSCSIEDLGRFALLHLQGLKAEDGPLRAETLARLHQPLEGDDTAVNYAAGWVVERSAAGEPKHWHGGSAGSFYATLSLYPDSDLAIAIATNCAGSSAGIVEELQTAIVRRWTQDAPAPR